MFPIYTVYTYIVYISIYHLLEILAVKWGCEPKAETAGDWLQQENVILFEHLYGFNSIALKTRW